MNTTTMWKLSALASVALLLSACNETTQTADVVTAKIDFDNAKKQESYAVGINAGKSMKTNIESLNGTNVELDLNVLTQAFADGLNGEAQLDDKTIAEAMKNFRARVNEALQVKRTAEAEAQKLLAANNKSKGAEFLAANSVKEGVVSTASGLQYKVLKPGSGKSPAATDRVMVHYTGTLTDGAKFDSSRDRGQPSTFGVNQVIKGWTEALQLMQEGAQWELYIPAELAYGATSRPKIPGNSVLVFDVELIEVVGNSGK